MLYLPTPSHTKVVAVPEVDRHPLYVAYYMQLERENTRCLLRASARNKMKRFITDVHTVWLTNLSHHPEFRRMTRGAAMLQEDGDGGGGGATNSNENGISCRNVANQPEATEPGTASRRGLDGGRDSAAIAASHSQIQSVNPERAFRGAFFYSSTSKDLSSSSLQLTTESANPKGDQHGGQQAGRKGSTTQLAAHNSLSYDRTSDSENVETPELSPPPLIAPTLTVLVSERCRLTAASTGGTATTRRSFGGGGGGGSRRRSVAGGGGAGGGDAGSWLDISTRMLRVLRFAPPPPSPSAMTKLSEDDDRDVDNDIKGPGDGMIPKDNTRAATAGSGEEKEGDAAPLPSSDTETLRQDGRTPLNERPPSLLSSTPEAEWMISSFHPYDGSETRVMIGDVAVSKVVGEALSASSPLPTAVAQHSGVAAPALSKKGGTGGASVSSSGTNPMASSKRQEEVGARLLVLRRGVRVPVLGEGGGVTGKVLSIVEVRCR